MVRRPHPSDEISANKCLFSGHFRSTDFNTATQYRLTCHGLRSTVPLGPIVNMIVSYYIGANLISIELHHGRPFCSAQIILELTCFRSNSITESHFVALNTDMHAYLTKSSKRRNGIGCRRTYCSDGNMYYFIVYRFPKLAA